ncbi:prophage DNA circulation protein [Paucimonas lemoignei]|uniref:Prophage DNA circulation protein n=1 Tax=Paucimonas lemoignei TaxID=29443 RepID=A0A4R3HUF4_PAULE|nr:DNA circularization N-terminal domain-containing protein [Paucimonas lemoignei]TCS35801.1 prophage DNA circulation protein [Paucimonas lemoignei]
MSFRDKLQPASFRGVPFEAPAAETVVGRRVVVHEFPHKDQPYAEDMGGKADEFVVDGFIIGENYLDGKEALIKALKKPGPGTLVHPTHGERQVVLVNPSRLREQFIERRGMVSFSLTFVEDGDKAQPQVLIDTQQVVEDAADASYGPLEDVFVGDFSVDGLPGWSIDAIATEVGQINDVISSVRDSLRLDMTSLSSLARAGNIFKSNIVGLLATPSALAGELTSLVRGIVGLFDFSAAQNQLFGARHQVKQPMNVLLPLRQYGQTGTAYARPSVPANTPLRRQQATSTAALYSLIARAAVVEAVRSSVYIPFDNIEASVAVRDQLYDAMEDVMLDAPDAVYEVLHALRSAMVRDITARGADLAQVSSVTLPASMPAQALSYRLYGSGNYADEIIARNQAAATIMHPLFVPGGTALGVRRV